VQTLEEFYADFQSDFQRAKETLGAPEVLEERTCPQCGAPLAKRPGPYGMFIGCTRYPECRYRESLERREVAPPVETDLLCERCGAKMVEKEGRFGRFLSCSTYPECKNARPLPTGIPCPSPGCDGELIQRRSKRGRFFYGCNRYPKCSFVLWSRPVPRPCPRCGAPYLVEGRKVLRCPTKGCKHQEPLPGTGDGEEAPTLKGGGEAH
jgi:DNA topoisomerase-1